MDSFSIISDANGNPNIAGHITPAISPIFGNNPAFTAYIYDRSSGDILDAETYYLTNLEDAAKGATPNWQLEYRFTETYGTLDMSAKSLVQAAKTIELNPEVRAKFREYYASSTSGTNPINDSNFISFFCAQTSISRKQFESCYCLPN